ncbi:MAG: GldG family protein, partial [Bdellovibrionales bacterium]|nr:GldG family protein [Bdellovibrionales bacterium]
MTKLNKIFSIIFGVLIFTFIIHIGSTLTRKVKIDFSEEHLYTLSSGSKKILSKIGQPLKMKLYYSKTAANKGSEGIREFNNYFRYVNDLLEEYVDNSHNQITLQVIDPRPDTVEEEEALAHGLKKFNITETESYIFGLVLINESGGESAIEFFNPQEQENLEYEITKLIYKSQHQSKKTLGILSSLNVVNDDISPYVAQMMRMQGRTPEESWIIIQQLKDFYNVKKIDLNAHEINGVDLLLVVHPKNFSDQTQFAIDQFVLKGKPVVLLIDPFAMVDSVGAQNDASSNLEALMSKWNVKMESHIFAGDKYLSAAGRVSPDAPPQRLIALVNCDQRCTSPYKDVISSSLNSNLFIYPGALNVIDKKITNINITPIISTTDKGNTYRAQQQMLRNPVALWDLFHEGSEPIYMGLKIQGHFKSAFPNGIEISTKQDEKEIKQ